MSAAVLKELMGRRPFEPFSVRLSDRDAYPVRHPEMALLLRNGIYVAVPEWRERTARKGCVVQLAACCSR